VWRRLRVGDAIVEVTPKPHNGCSKLDVRSGADALRFVGPSFASFDRPLNLRGIYGRGVEAGDAAVGCSVSVIFRPM
jgi:hypothetical protein